MELERAIWTLGDRIGEGGMGSIYDVTSAEYGRAVAKLVPKAPGAERELLFADLTGARNVIPVLDRGETGDYWVIVMPKADKSLRERLEEAGGPIATGEAVGILLDIAVALTDLAGGVVHRDLKPENILLCDGRWCVADFGISRYAEAATGSNTRKHAGSAFYAAPEQWRGERAEASADVYAFGVIGYELLAGARPFTGPDYRDQHLNKNPEPLTGVPDSLGALVEECLYKAPGARPSAAAVLSRLERVTAAAAARGVARLQAANRANVIRQGEIGRQASVLQSEADRRQELATVAVQALKRMAATLKEVITDSAPSASVSTGIEPWWTIALNRAELRLAPPMVAVLDPWGARGKPAFEVIAFSELNLHMSEDRHGYEGRSHSLWYCDAQEAGRCQWFETAFMIPGLRLAMTRQEPFGLKPGEDAAGAVAAAWPDRAQIAWPFTPLNVGELDDFISRWTEWFADASEGKLARPGSLPERPVKESWRQH